MTSAPPLVRIHTIDVSNPLSSQQSALLQPWIEQVVEQEEGKLSGLNIIFCSDEYLRQLNQTHLQHDYYTDILTFDTSEGGGEIEGDLFISTDRVRSNATEFNVSFQEELHRVIIHGVLHLLGYQDNTDSQQQKMRERENKCLQLFKQLRQEEK